MNSRNEPRAPYRRVPMRLVAPWLAALALVAAPRPAAAQVAGAAEEAGAVISLIELADTEYADAVADGEIVNAAEYEEAGEFTAEALRRLARLADPADAVAADRARAAAGRLPGLIERLAEPAEFAELAEEVADAVAAGWEAVRVRYAERRPSAHRGARVYRQHCAVCHGAAGAGDGPAAAGMEPPPADLAGPNRHMEASLLRDFEVTSFGIPATQMTGWGDRLSLQERWDVAAYVQGFRFDAAEVSEGRDIALAPDAPIGGLVRAWSDPSEIAALTDEELARRVAEVQSGADEAEVAAIVAYLRAQIGQPLDGVPSPEVAETAKFRFAEIDSLLTSAIAAAREGDRELAADRAIGAYLIFESLEPAVGARNPDAVRAVEAGFAGFRADIATAAGEIDRSALDGALDEAAAALTGSASDWGIALQSFVIILREGFEAILIIGAIMAFLVKTGRAEERRSVAWGIGGAIAASLAVGVLLEALFTAVPARREILEGVTMLVAVAVLFSVSYWLVSKLERGRWESYLDGKMRTAAGAGSAAAFAGVAFLAVFREGVETVLFYKALSTMSGDPFLPIVLGFVVGVVALVVIYSAYIKLGVRVPMRPFFGMTSALLYGMAVIFSGAGVAEFQEAGVVGMTPVAGVPTVPTLGLYPTLETLAAQGTLVALLVVALFVTFVLPRLRTSASTAGSGA